MSKNNNNKLIKELKVFILDSQQLNNALQGTPEASMISGYNMALSLIYDYLVLKEAINA